LKPGILESENEGINKRRPETRTFEEAVATALAYENRYWCADEMEVFREYLTFLSPSSPLQESL